MADEVNKMVHRQLLECINQEDTKQMSRILDLGQIHIDDVDENGMTLLMSASYKGKPKTCQLLIEKGADVNCNHHEHNYTPLMFACLAGKLETIKILLEGGAEKRAVNNIGRTAAQLGAFTGQHECVSVINNFISKKELECYTKLQGGETSPKLDPELLNDVQKFILIHNLSPVKLVLHLEENMSLLENYKSIVKVLKLKSDACFRDMQEVVAMKLHYQACVLDHCGRWYRGILGQNGIDGFLKHLIKGRPKDGFPLGTEDFIRQAIRDFPYQESTVFKQLLTSIAPIEKGEDPTALTCLSQLINGIQSVEYENICATCAEGKAGKRCGACKKVVYCNEACQKRHWFTHKKQCKNVTKGKTEKTETTSES